MARLQMPESGRVVQPLNLVTVDASDADEQLENYEPGK